MKNSDIYKYIPLYVLDYPAFIYSIALLISKFSWRTLLLTPIIFMGSSLWGALLTKAYNIFYLKKFLHEYIKNYNGCCFYRFNLEAFVPNSMIELLLSERKGISLTNEPLGYICVVKRDKGKQWPTSMSTFPFEVIPWYITCPDFAENITPYQRFQLFHEIGHTTLFHRLIIERRLSSILQSMFFITILFCILKVFSLPLMIIIILSLLWSLALSVRKTYPVEYEQLADAFSLLYLDEFERVEAIRLHKLFLVSLGNDEHSDRRLEVLHQLEANDINNDVNQTTLKAFNRQAIDASWPQFYYYFLILIAVVISVFITPHLLLIDILITFFLCTILPLIIFFPLAVYENIFRKKIDSFMIF